MTLTIELPPELETQLLLDAARSGQTPEALALATLASGLRPILSVSIETPILNPVLSLEEFDAALDELEACGADIPTLDDEIAYSREDIYFDHD